MTRRPCLLLLHTYGHRRGPPPWRLRSSRLTGLALLVGDKWPTPGWSRGSRRCTPGWAAPPSGAGLVVVGAQAGAGRAAVPRLRGVAELLQRHLSLQRHHDQAHLGVAARGVADGGGGAGDEARPPSCRSRSVTQSTRPLRWGSCRGRMVSDSDSEATAAGGDGVAGGASCWGRRPAGRRAQGGAARREGRRAGRAATQEGAARARRGGVASRKEKPIEMGGLYFQGLGLSIWRPMQNGSPNRASTGVDF